MFGAGLAVGLVVGAIIGVLFMAMFRGGSMADDMMEQEHD